MNLKKFLTISSLALLTMTSLTACVELNTFTGQVEIVEKKHSPSRPKIGSMPAKMSSWKLELCPDNVDPGAESCWTERIHSSEYDRVNEGDMLDVVNGEVAIP